jgi:hypothetical protein
MAVEIPSPGLNDVDVTVRVPLDGAFYAFRQRYNERAGTWMLDILTGDGAVLAQGIALRADAPVNLHLRARDGMLQGALMPLDTSGAGRDPGIGELGARVRLIYLSPEELAEAGL